jgi:hypothetical protein
MKDSIAKLLEICDIESDDRKVGWKKRREAMENWIADHVIEAETELSVVNPEVFNTDMMDFIKERLALQASEELTSQVKYEINKNKIKAKLTVLKREKHEQ